MRERKPVRPAVLDALANSGPPRNCLHPLRSPSYVDAPSYLITLEGLRFTACACSAGHVVITADQRIRPGSPRPQLAWG